MSARSRLNAAVQSIPPEIVCKLSDVLDRLLDVGTAPGQRPSPMGVLGIMLAYVFNGLHDAGFSADDVRALVEECIAEEFSTPNVDTRAAVRQAQRSNLKKTSDN